MLAALLSPTTFKRNLRSPSPTTEKSKSATTTANCSNSNLLEVTVTQFTDCTVSTHASLSVDGRYSRPHSPNPIPVPASVVPVTASSPISPPSSSTGSSSGSDSNRSSIKSFGSSNASCISGGGGRGSATGYTGVSRYQLKLEPDTKSSDHKHSRQNIVSPLLNSASKMLLSRSWNGNGPVGGASSSSQLNVQSSNCTPSHHHGKRLSLDDIQPFLSPTRLHTNRLILPLGTKEIEFTVPQTLSPLTPTFGRKGMTTSGDSSPAGSLSGSRSETDPSTSRANTPSPIFFRGSGSDIAGACSSIACSLGGLNPELYKTSKSKNGEGDEDQSDDDDEDDDVRGDLDEYSQQEQNYYGHVKFALEYDNKNEKLLVTRIRARNLLTKSQSPNSSYGSYGSNSSSSGSSVCNPFVRVSLFPDERRTLQSKPKTETRHPHFHEVFGFQVSHTGLDERSLKLCFYDVDQNKKHSMLGYIVQPLKDIDWSFGKQVFKQDLLRDLGELSPNIGEILVSLCYNANISRLTVTLFEARGIKTSESASGLYAKILFSQHTKVIKTKKTSTVTLLGCRSNFNESFNFKLPAEQLDTASVSIQLMYAQPGYNKDQTAGRIVLGSFMFARGKGLDHWTEMLSKQKEQIQYWHQVSE